MTKNGVVFGRFQPVHKGHIEHLLTAKDNCSHLFVGITNPDPLMTKEDYANKDRSKSINNPFTYYERSKMVEDLFISSNISHNEFTIVPFPLHSASILKYYCPLDSTFYISIYETWGIRKQKILESYNLNVNVMFNNPDANRKISGSNIRKLILEQDDSWKNQVPDTTLNVLKHIDLQERFNSLK